MIRKPTVLVLGAGASKPYGFPSGTELSHRVVRALLLPTKIKQVLRPYLRGVDVGQFVSDFRASGCDSLDAFVETRPNYLKLAKAAIAATLIPHESETALNPGDESRDWYRYLWNRVLPRTPQAFVESPNLRVVTFNFDRSFERRLFLTAKAKYDLSALDAGDVASAVSVIHLHGQLGHPNWLGFERLFSRGYTVNDAEDPETISKCAESLHIIHEDIDPAVIEAARAALAWAETICFIGFGYHHVNLERLHTAGLRTQTIFGTAFGFTEAELGPVRKSFHGTTKPAQFFLNTDALTILRETDVIHG